MKVNISKTEAIKNKWLDDDDDGDDVDDGTVQ